MPSKKKLTLTGVALIAATPMLLLGSGAAFATDVEEPLVITVEMPDAVDATVVGDEAIQDMPAQDEGVEDLPDAEESNDANTDEIAPVDEAVIEESGEPEKHPIQNAPTFNAEFLNDPPRLVISGATMEGMSWDELRYCYLQVMWDGGGFATTNKDIVSAGAYTFSIPSGVKELELYLSCVSAEGDYSPNATKTISLDNGESGNGNTGGNENSGNGNTGNGGNTNTGTDTDGGTGAVTVGTSAPTATSAEGELALTGGSNSLVLGLSAAGVAALGAGLILARRFTKSA